MEFWRDPVWQSIGALIALIALVLGIIIPLILRKRKVITFDIYSCSSLLSFSQEKELRGKLQITFQGITINNLWIYEVRFINSGNTPIQKNDYDTDLSINFPEESKVIACEVAESKPPDCQPELTLSNSCISISPLLINRRDTFSLKILVSQEEKQIPQILGRISGTQIKKKQDTLLIIQIISSIFLIISMMIILIVPPSGFVISATPFDSNGKFSLAEIIMVSLTCLSFIGFMYSITPTYIKVARIFFRKPNSRR